MRFLCKDCWIAHEAATLLARCKRCEANTRMQRLEPLPAKLGRSLAGGALVCKLHGAEPLDVFCNACERSVPPRAVLSDRSIVALLGDTASGKTSYLWVLSEQLRSSSNGGIYIRQALGDSDEQMAKAARDVLDGGRATPLDDANVRNYAWELAIGERATTVMAFHDAAGEVWNELAGLSRVAYERFYRYLELMGSVVFTIDGEHVATALDAEERKGIVPPSSRAAQSREIAIVDAITRRVRARGQRMPASAVITKADVLWDREAWKDFHEDSNATGETIGKTARELLLQSGRKALVQALEHTFSPVRYFAISAFGQKMSAPMRVEDLRPVRVADPLLALIGHPALRT